MKKTLLSLSLITLALIGKAQNCSDLIISEYVEGSGNNKALEFYNTSSSPVSLSNYRVIRWDNGSTTSDGNPEGVMQLPINITLQPYKTYVIALNLTDPAGTGQTAPIDVALQNASDTLLCPGCATGTGNSRVMCFNGDDALELQKTTNGGGSWNTVDMFACKGERPENSQGTYSPGAGWTILSPFYQMPLGYDSQIQGPYFKQYWTQDKTLKRKKTILNGVATNPASGTFNASVQWDSLPVGTYSDLGVHVCDCNQVGLKEVSKNIYYKVFPNPNNGSALTFTSDKNIKEIKIINSIGQTAYNHIVSGVQSTVTLINLGLEKGMYSVILTNELGIKAQKIIVQ